MFITLKLFSEKKVLRKQKFTQCRKMESRNANALLTYQTLRRMEMVELNSIFIVIK